MWAEKYRPKTLDEIVGQDRVVRYLKSVINNGGELNHCIFYGASGTGKTSTAYALANELNTQVIEFNASDDRTLNFVREKIIPAMRYKSFSGEYKIIFLDEADNLMKDSLFALRRPMETYYKNARIIFSCNDVSVFNQVPAIKSRCIVFQFKPLQPEDIAKRLRQICTAEGVQVGDSVLRYISKKAHGDMRIAINMLESYVNGGLEINEFELELGI